MFDKQDLAEARQVELNPTALCGLGQRRIEACREIVISEAGGKFNISEVDKISEAEETGPAPVILISTQVSGGSRITDSEFCDIEFT